MRRYVPLVPLALWLLLCVPLALGKHFALQTNAFDLSVFDYALWSTGHGHLGHVPFMAHSLFAHHFMPTLLLLVPLHLLAPSPVLLIVAQLLLTAAAVIALGRLASIHAVSPGIAAAVTACFLFSRPSYNAIMSVFYIESAAPLLIFLLLLAWERRRWGAYWILVVLALGCKEDMALYIGTFGLLEARRSERRRSAILTVCLATVWLALAVGYAIPAARAADGLPQANPFLEARYADTGGSPASVAVLERLLTARPWIKVFNLTTAVALLCWAAPGTFAVAFPGMLVNLVARPDTMQSALVGHYAWPVLPWMFVAAITAAARLVRRWPGTKKPIVVLLLVPAILDTPLWLNWLASPWRTLPAARQVREQLAAIPAVTPVLAQGNLIPHLQKRPILAALGREGPTQELDYVLLSEIGDLWPLGFEKTHALITKYLQDPEYEAVCRGPLFAFRRRISLGAAPQERDQFRWCAIPSFSEPH